MSNTIILSGNLTRSPELRFTQSGRAVCNVGLADEHRYMQGSEWQSETTFHELTIWGDMGANAAASLAKGMTVIVEGRLKSRQYEDAEGNKRTAMDIIVTTIGPSLRWATAEVTKTSTTTGGAPAERASSNRGSSQTGSGPVYGDDEPFVSLYAGHHSYANMSATEAWL